LTVNALGHRIDWHAIVEKLRDKLDAPLFGRLDHAPPEISVAASAGAESVSERDM
jgi:hypothetical protein